MRQTLWILILSCLISALPAQPIPPNVADPSFSDADKATQRQAGEKMREDLLTAAARGDKQFTIAPGEYRFSAMKDRGSVISLEKASHLAIVGQGARIWLEGFCGGFEFKNCDGISLTGVSFDYDPLPFVQGRITEINPDENSLLVETEPSFGMDRILSVNGGRMPNWATADVCDPATRRLKEDSISFSMKSCTVVDSGHIRLMVNRVPWKDCNVAIGDLIVLRRPVGTVVISQEDCKDMVFDSVDVCASLGMAFIEQRCETSTHYLHCKVARPVGSLRLRSSGADAFHSSMGVQGPVYEDCTVEASGDDAYTMHGYLDFVMQQSAPDKITIAPLRDRNFDVGSTLTFFSFPGFEKIGTAKVLSYTVSQDDDLLKEARQLAAEASKVPGGRIIRMATKEVVEVQLDQSLNLPRLTVVQTNAYESTGARVIRSSAENVRGRGVSIESSDCLVENDKIDWTTGPAIEISGDIPWMQGPFSHDIVVRNNTFADTLLSRDSRVRNKMETALGAVSVHIHTSQLVHACLQERIQIEDNQIDGCYAPGIAVQNASDVLISGNQLRNTNKGQPFYLGLALGLDPRFAILMAEVQNSVVEKNTIQTPLPDGVRELGINVERPPSVMPAPSP